MLVKTALLTLAVAVQQISALSVPADAVDGFYRAWLDDAGVEHHEAMHDALPSAVSERRAPPSGFVTKRDNDIHCGCGRHLGGTDTDSAVSNLRAQLGNGAEIKGHLSYYAIRGNTVAFVCNPGAFTARITANDAANAYSHITRKCGYYIAGTEAHETNIGYMFKGENGGNFCGAATASNSHSC